MHYVEGVKTNKRVLQGFSLPISQVSIVHAETAYFLELTEHSIFPTHKHLLYVMPVMKC